MWKASRWNILTACTNLVALWPLKKACDKQDVWTFTLVGFATSASFFSHLFESHKHGMIGFGCPPKISQYLNYWDRVGCALLAPYIAYKAWNEISCSKLCQFGMIAALLFACNLISEWDKSLSTQTRYLLFHNLWHMGIFGLLGAFF